MLLRRGGDALGEEVQLLGEDRQLARLRAPQLAVDADDVAQVEALGELPVVADLLLADEELNLAGPVADVDEDQLAAGSLQHDAARPRGPWGRPSRPAPCSASHLRKSKPSAGESQIGQRDVAAIGRAENDLAGAGANVGDRRVIVEPRSPRIVAELGDLLAACRGATTSQSPAAAFRLCSVTVLLMVCRGATQWGARF